MDQETLTNHLSHMGKALFDQACRTVLRGVFNLNAINVDGRDDGGTDFISVTSDFVRSNVAYQITTQKSQIQKKSYLDAKKAIAKLGVNRFYFLTTVPLTETEARKIESEISNDLNIQGICFGSKHLAGFLIEEPLLLNKFLDECNYPLPRGFATSPDYREMALHAYTLMSKDSIDMREGIYDDTILFVLSDNTELEEAAIIDHVLKFLGIDKKKEIYIKQRIGALFYRQLLRRTEGGFVTLTQKAKDNLDSRKRVYEKELGDLAAAQVDIMRRDFNSDWSLEDSKTVSVFIADIYVSKQIEVLKDIKASVVINPIFNVEDRGMESFKNYLLKTGKVSAQNLDSAIEKLIKAASDHPLTNKLARASVYVALEGANPISSAKALGAARWSDYQVLLEPTVAIPWICSQLYHGNERREFDASVKAVQRAIDLNSSPRITYFYINECAGHLLRARRYAGLSLDEGELQYSSNAFISNYYFLKAFGARIPLNIMDYLKTFSPSIATERLDAKEWVRSIMTDIQTILTKSGVEFIESPNYNHDQCAVYEKEYIYNLMNFKVEKARHLIDHDVWALQLTNDLITKNQQHWLILTYDRSLLEVGKADAYPGWVATPTRFLDLTETYKPLAEAHYVSLVHSLATYSEKTLSAGARIIDRIILYASKDMQNWEFRNELEKFKKEIIDSTDLNMPNVFAELDSKTDEFLKSHGIKIYEDKIEEDELVDQITTI